ncbi:hypothetical protein [Pinibacter aurantiacus]|uniref:Nuclear transport factor 2 family protein n=1 Tax=Pinibacter aurantiacus TaxID=2851599 RepID=A0A9E2SDY6_9BACT|nr:hypothetical protein [Pinibacter aurantiacus]MBV4359677.1 hypothetical protein [Pinibacter aurantiacus]
MRKTSFFVAITFLVACNSGTDKSKMETPKNADSTTMPKQQSLTYPYTADYSSDFEIGDAKNAQTLLQLYRDFDNNTLENSKNSFAENDTMIFASGNMFVGTRDSLIALATKSRGQMGSVVDSVHAWVPLKSKDRNEDWVLIWSREISTDAKGKKTVRELQETWRFDKNGKINLMYQYVQESPKMTPPPKKK